MGRSPCGFPGIQPELRTAEAGGGAIGGGAGFDAGMSMVPCGVWSGSVGWGAGALRSGAGGAGVFGTDGSHG